MGSASERRCYFPASYLIGWAHTYYDPSYDLWWKLRDGLASGNLHLTSNAVHRRIYMSVNVTESSIMPFYDHDDRTIIETDASSRWLPGLSLEALKLAFSASGDGWGGHPGRRIRFIDEIALHSYLLYTVFNTLRPRQDGCLFADDILKCIFLNGNSWIPNKISWEHVA